MKKINIFKIHQLTDKDYQTVVGGHDCEGTETRETVLICQGGASGYHVTYDWKDEGCCEEGPQQ